MMRAALLLLTLLASATLSATVPDAPPSLAQIAREAQAAEARATALEAKAGAAKDEAARFAADQAAAAAQIDAAEARIAATRASLDAARRAQAESEAALARRRAPLAGLLAGLATMGRQPPLLSLADGTSPQELVRLQAMIDTVRPAIEAKSALLRSDVEARRKLSDRVEQALAVLAKDRAALNERKQRFAALERQAIARSAGLSAEAFGAGDVALAGGEELGDAQGAARRQSEALSLARQAAALGLLPARPTGPDARPDRPPLPYTLPAEARVTEGVGSVGPYGVSARGISLATRAGQPLAVPADGRILYAGPYRRQRGVVIVDHGRGWVSLLTGVATDLAKGATVRRGDPLGRALGPLSVELRHGANWVSPALISRSSALLSNASKRG